ncbi:substrate binding domain-containing protein [Enterobacteriaceae bacterium ESL0689]|nr:substrate binding domain-containing protein [Enterobacteriaceae bacterium ESL0689]
MKLYPEIKIDLMVSNRIVDLTALNIDIAIRVGTLKDSDWIAKELLISKNILCASKNYLDMNGYPKHPSELSQHKIIGSSASSVWAFNNIRSQKSCNIDVNAYFIADDVDVNIFASKDDLGICFVPSQFTHSSIKDNTLIHVLPEWEGHSRSIYLLFRDRSHIPNRVKVFKEYIEGYIK